MALPINITEFLKRQTGVCVRHQQQTTVACNYRNRRIGDFLKEIHLTEGRSTGIPTIYKFMNQNGSPLPIFETDDDRCYFLTILKVHPLVKKMSNAKKTPKLKSDVTENVTENRLKTIIEEVRLNNLISIDHLAERLNVTRRTIIRDIEKLKKKNRILRVGPDKGGYWEEIP